MSARRKPLEFHLLNLKALPLIEPVEPSRLEEHRSVLLGRDALTRLMAVAGKASRQPQGSTWSIPAQPQAAARPSSAREARLQQLEHHLVERLARFKALSEARAREFARRDAEQRAQAKSLRAEATRLAGRAAELDEREADLQRRSLTLAQQLEQLINARQRLQTITQALDDRPPLED
ncbi:hypothetical protein ACPA5B_25585 [Pseudomonas solani]|uniref:hypothetical protein n=1 Tax=Pseudomonas solani TaxID=2731552 RepID=UPI003C2C0A79